ncbi:DUF4367 domain-containing protein [Bacillus spongiae]|uniref:DUF4367 domain-containing protein n=1 Tax=Bacillus spongiae TaxID=2683610 RepID=A0ABU8HKM9_9BACI
MKKTFVFLTVLFLTACANFGAFSSLEDFDNSSLKEELKGMAFQPKLPTITPFKVTDTQVIYDENQDNLMVIDFMSLDESDNRVNNRMSLEAFNGGNIEERNMRREEVEIGEITGRYKVNDAEAMILEWDKDGIYYSLIFYGKQSEKEVTKEELIKTAESFE